jgi:type IV pilus assembly protein PilV
MHLITTQRGVSLVEVMVAITVLGFGLLGLAGTQARTTVLNDSAYNRSIAVDLSNDLADRMRAIRTPYMVNADADPKPSKPPDFSKCPAIYSDTDTCSAQDADRATHATLAQTEMREWGPLLQRQLPGATYTLTKVASGSTDYFRYTLIIKWLDNRRTGTELEYRVVIE